ncbi:hypothetical protein CN918_30515 [Priestia megaterium]|nr:hypothetical protein CN918_30515 [Priestia megaterium]
MNDRLIEICSLLNIPQVSISKICGVGRPTVNEWFTGKRPVPKHHIQTLSLFYGVPAEALVKEKPLTNREMVLVFQHFIEKKIGQEVHIRIRRPSPHNPA